MWQSRQDKPDWIATPRGLICFAKSPARAPEPFLAPAFSEGVNNNSLERLEAFSYENGGEIVAWLRERVNDMEFEQIAEMKLADSDK